MSSSRAQGLLAIAPISLVLLAPRVAEACSVCGGGRDDKTQFAFLIGSIFLSVLPLALIGVGTYVLVCRARRIAAEEAAGIHRLPERTSRAPARAAATPPAAPVAPLRIGRPAGS